MRGDEPSRVKRLLDNGASINYRDRFGHTVFDYLEDFLKHYSFNHQEPEVRYNEIMNLLKS